MVPSASPKPFITANQVTFLRLALLPVGAYCLYGSMTARYFALVFMTLVGCTDFVDGYLARKYGVSKLGSLMDPIADKVFVAVVFMPFAHMRWLPIWIVAGIFIREFLVTAARTMHERRGIALRSSYLGKVKTWYQMAGAGICFVLLAVNDKPRMLQLFGAALVVSLMVFLVVLALRKPDLRKPALIFVGSFAMLLSAQAVLSRPGMLAFMGLGMLAITWLSGLEYLISGVRRIGAKLDGADYVRAFSAVAVPTMALLVVCFSHVPVWPFVVVVALEMSVGGLDNLLAHYGVAQSGLAWGLRSFALLALMTVIAIERPGAASLRIGLSYGLCALSVLATSRLFWRFRSYYIDERPVTEDGRLAASVAAEQ